jgi:putative SOS response-associated peptidase YedK
MCGRYVRRGSAEAAGKWFDIEPEDLPQFSPSYNVAPQSVQPVVLLGAENDRREMHLMRWGLIPFWAKDPKIGYSTFNARAEDIAAKPAFRESLKRRRCLIPASEFYAWQKLSARQRQPYAFGLTDAEFFGFAGLWDRWKSPDGNTLESFTIITTDANELLNPEHGAPVHDRIPVILDRKDYARWLAHGDPSQLPIDLLRPYPSEKMRAWPVSSDVGSVKNNYPELIDPDTPPAIPDGSTASKGLFS